MRNWRVLTAIAAVVLAALAGVLVYQYVSDADERAEKDVAVEKVLVAAREIPRGTTGQAAIDEKLVEITEVPRKYIPETALRNTRGLATLVASGAITEGQYIVEGSFVAPAQLEGFADAIKDGMAAISITVDETRGVAGFVQPNDRINVLVSIEGLQTEVAADGALRVLPKTTAFLLPGVRVLAVGSTTALSTPAPAPTGDTTAQPQQVEVGLLTLEVTPRQAEQIVHAQQYGSIYLSLNPPDFDPEDFDTPQEVVEAINLFDQDLTVVQNGFTRVVEAPPAPTPAATP